MARSGFVENCMVSLYPAAFFGAENSPKQVIGEMLDSCEASFHQGMMFQRHMKVMDLACVLEEFWLPRPIFNEERFRLSKSRNGKNDIFTSHLIGR